MEYPSTESKQKGMTNVKDFIEKENHILIPKKNISTDVKLPILFILTAIGMVSEMV